MLYPLGLETLLVTLVQYVDSGLSESLKEYMVFCLTLERLTPLAYLIGETSEEPSRDP